MEEAHVKTAASGMAPRFRKEKNMDYREGIKITSEKIKGKWRLFEVNADIKQVSLLRFIWGFDIWLNGIPICKLFLLLWIIAIIF